MIIEFETLLHCYLYINQLHPEITTFSDPIKAMMKNIFNCLNLKNL